MICSGTPPPPYTPLSLHMRPAVSITLGESLRYGVPRPHVAAAVDAVVYTHAARWRNCPIFVVTHMPLTTKGFDHKTPIRTSFDQRFNRNCHIFVVTHMRPAVSITCSLPRNRHCLASHSQPMFCDLTMRSCRNDRIVGNSGVRPHRRVRSLDSKSSNQRQKNVSAVARAGAVASAPRGGRCGVLDKPVAGEMETLRGAAASVPGAGAGASALHRMTGSVSGLDTLRSAPASGQAAPRHLGA